MAADGVPAPPVPFSELTFVEAKKQLQEAGPGKQLVDVRTPEEFAAGHIKGSINVPLPRFQDPHEIDKVIEELKGYKPGVVVTCFQSIKRGPAAAAHLVARLRQAGVSDLGVCVLKGGVEGVQRTPELASFVEGNAAPAH